PPPERGRHRRPPAAVLSAENADAEHRLCRAASRVGVYKCDLGPPTRLPSLRSAVDLPLSGGGTSPRGPAALSPQRPLSRRLCCARASLGLTKCSRWIASRRRVARPRRVNSSP